MTASVTPPITAPVPPAIPVSQAIPDWLRMVCFGLFFANLSLCPIAYLLHCWIYDSNGLGIPTDYINVWAAGRLVLEGHPAHAYDWDIQKPIEVAQLGQYFDSYFAWHYPPPFLFVAAVLAWLPYSVGYIGWVSVSLVPYVAAIRAIVGQNFGYLVALAIPTVLINAYVGQNGFLTAGLIAGTLYLIPVRPILAGVCLGLLTYKPQYGLLFPVVLIAASHWRVFFSAAATAVAMALVSWLVFGTESWLAFFHWMPKMSQAFLSDGKASWWRLQSLFSLVRYLGGSEALAWGFHWVLTASVAVVLVLMWRGRVPYTLKAAALAAGTLLTTPYLFMYDVMVLAIPVAFLFRIGLKTGFRSYELPALGGVLLLFGAFMVAEMPTGFAATLVVSSLILRRAGPWWRHEPAPALAAARA